MGRATLEFDNGGPFTASAKLFATRYNGDGAGAFAQNIGPCAADGKPRSYGNVDPYGDCRPDDQTSYGDIPDVVAAAMPPGGGDGRARDHLTRAGERRVGKGWCSRVSVGGSAVL